MMTPTMLKEMVRSASPEVDRAVYLEPTFAAAFASALDEGFVQGPDGYARDTLLVMQRWPFDPAEIRQPVHLWYGSVDASPFHSLDFGASLARRIPGATRTVVEGAGGSNPVDARQRDPRGIARGAAPRGYLKKPAAKNAAVPAAPTERQLARTGSRAPTVIEATSESGTSCPALGRSDTTVRVASSGYAWPGRCNASAHDQQRAPDSRGIRVSGIRSSVDSAVVGGRARRRTRSDRSYARRRTSSPRCSSR